MMVRRMLKSKKRHRSDGSAPKGPFRVRRWIHEPRSDAETATTARSPTTQHPSTHHDAPRDHGEQPTWSTGHALVGHRRKPSYPTRIVIFGAPLGAWGERAFHSSARRRRLPSRTGTPYRRREEPDPLPRDRKSTR